MIRGYSAIALHNPKFGVNVGGVLRAATNYNAALVVLGKNGCRVRSCADTVSTYRHKPIIRIDDVFDAIPFDCVPIAVDLVDDAEPLHDYVHPERAFYIFGAEDATLGSRILDRCKDKIYIPTVHCMNLAATVNVVLYDRAVKRGFPR